MIGLKRAQLSVISFLQCRKEDLFVWFIVCKRTATGRSPSVGTCRNESPIHTTSSKANVFFPFLFYLLLKVNFFSIWYNIWLLLNLPLIVIVSYIEKNCLVTLTTSHNDNCFRCTQCLSEIQHSISLSNTIFSLF